MSEENKEVHVFLNPELRSENLGKKVAVQVFRRMENDSDTLVSDRFAKHIGTLEGFSFDEKNLNIQLRGMPMIMSSRRRHYVEVILKD